MGDIPANLETREQAIEFLASELYWRLERLDPSDEREGDIDWRALDDREKEIYRQGVKIVLAHPTILTLAMERG